MQCVYFDNIDEAKANEAVEAMHDSIEWIHTQVWEHDGHDSSYVDNLNGREAVKFFLTERVKEMQVEGAPEEGSATTKKNPVSNKKSKALLKS